MAGTPQGQSVQFLLEHVCRTAARQPPPHAAPAALPRLVNLYEVDPTALQAGGRVDRFCRLWGPLYVGFHGSPFWFPSKYCFVITKYYNLLHFSTAYYNLLQLSTAYYL